MPYTTTELLADVRRSGMLPSSTSTGTADADLLAQADKEMQIRVVPLVMSTREEFYVRSQNYTLTASQSAYRIPPRAIGAKLRDVELVFSDGSAHSLPRISPEDAPAYGSATTAAYPSAFYVERDSIVFVPTPSTTSGTARLKFFARPSRLVAVSATATPTVATVTVNYSSSGRTRITHSASGTTLATGTWDAVRAKSGFEHSLFGVTVTHSGAGYIEIADADCPSGFTTANNAGDYISAEDTTPVLQCPVELHNFLAQRVLCRILQAIGDDLLPAAEADAEEMRKAALQLLSNRVEGEPKKIVGSLLNRRSRSWGLL